MNLDYQGPFLFPLVCACARERMNSFFSSLFFVLFVPKKWRGDDDATVRSLRKKKNHPLLFDGASFVGYFRGPFFLFPCSL